MTTLYPPNLTPELRRIFREEAREAVHRAIATRELRMKLLEVRIARARINSTRIEFPGPAPFDESAQVEAYLQRKILEIAAEPMRSDSMLIAHRRKR